MVVLRVIRYSNLINNKHKIWSYYLPIPETLSVMASSIVNNISPSVSGIDNGDKSSSDGLCLSKPY